MRALVQRVSEARVRVGEQIVGEIAGGVCVLVGVTHTDTPVVAAKLADKVWNLRIFDDVEGVMNRSLADTSRAALVVSQFTLYGDTTRGRRPGWSAAAPPTVAAPVVEAFEQALRALGARVETGRFRADMHLSLTNDGPVTLMIEIENEAE